VKGKAPALRLVGTVTQTGVEGDFAALVPVEIHLPGGQTTTHGCGAAASQLRSVWRETASAEGDVGPGPCRLAA